MTTLDHHLQPPTPAMSERDQWGYLPFTKASDMPECLKCGNREYFLEYKMPGEAPGHLACHCRWCGAIRRMWPKDSSECPTPRTR